MKKIINILILLTLFTFSAPGTLAAEAEPVKSVTDRSSAGLQQAVNEIYGGGEEVSATSDSFVGGLVKIINNLLTFTGVIFLLILIYGGWLWMTARGNEEQIAKAKKITQEIVIGLIIIVLARLFTEFILSQIGTAIDKK